MTNRGSRNRDSQTLRVDGNADVGRPDRPQCHQQVNVLIEHLLCARCYSEGWRGYDQDAEQDQLLTPREGGRQGDKQLGCSDKQSVVVPSGARGGDGMSARLGRIRKGFGGGFPGGAVVKNLPASAWDMGSSPGPGRSHMPWSN